MERFSLEFALAVAEEAHTGQVDKAGVEYLLHPLTVMDIVDGEEAKIVALLHDVVEDSDATFEYLDSLGCPVQVVGAVRLLTHGKDFDGTLESYFQNIQIIAGSGNQLVIDVKYADNTNNLNPSRIDNPTERDFIRWDKYRKSREILYPFVSNYLKVLV